jgi:pyruvate dehydrogenase phosphatase
METLEQLRKKLLSLCLGTKLEEEGVHTVTFQPLPSRITEDRVVTKSWDINGQRWLFLAVCDGHCGTITAEYTAWALPERICAALGTLNPLPNRPDLNNDQDYQGRISTLLSEEIEKFDREIGEAVIALCNFKKPMKLTEAQARDLVQKHSEVLSRAYHGTTITIALLNRTQEAVWLAGVGDSTVGEYKQIGFPELAHNIFRTLSAISCTNADGTRTGERLLDLHTSTTPSEYFRVSMSHPAAEREVFVDDRLLDVLSMTRG